MNTLLGDEACEEVIVPSRDLAPRAQGILAVGGSQKVMRLCLIVVKLAGAWSVRTRHSSSRNIMSMTPVQAVFNRPMAAHDRSQESRDHNQWSDIKPRFLLGFSIDLATAFDHHDGFKPWSVMAFLKPFDIMDDGRGAGFDTAMIAIDGGVLADPGIGEAAGLLLSR
jgi:hypothetical protein